MAPSGWSDDHGDVLGEATRIEIEDTDGNLTEDDQDWFRIDVFTPGRHWIYTTGDTDTRGTLYDAAGNFIAGGFNDDDDGARRNFAIERILQVGTYYLMIDDGTEGVTTGDYRLSVRSPDFSKPFVGPNQVDSLNRLGDIRLYQMNLQTTGRIWIYTTGGTDTEGTVYDQAGNFLFGGFNDDDDGAGRNFLSSEKLAAGNYYLRVRSGGAGILTGTYTLSIRNKDHARVFEGSDMNGSLGILGDLDYYRLQLTEVGPFWLYTTGETDTRGTLYDEAGNLIAGGFNDDDDGAGRNFLIARTLAPGTYYLLIEHGSDGVLTGAYRLSFRDPARAFPLLMSGSLNQRIDLFGEHDLFVFATTGGEIAFSSEGITDTKATIYDPAGSFVDGGFNDQNDGVGNNFYIDGNVIEGTYYLLISGENADLVRGDYTLHSHFEEASLTRLSVPSQVVTLETSTTLNVTSSIEWAVGDLPSWITVSPMNGAGTGTLTFTFSPNLSGTAREASVLVGDQTYHVSQRPQGDVGTTLEDIEAMPAYVITVPSRVGITYKVQTSVNLVEWIDTGVTIQGDGTPQNVAFSMEEHRGLYRVIEQ